MHKTYLSIEKGSYSYLHYICIRLEHQNLQKKKKKWGFFLCYWVCYHSFRHTLISMIIFLDTGCYIKELIPPPTTKSMTTETMTTTTSKKSSSDPITNDSGVAEKRNETCQKYDLKTKFVIKTQNPPILHLSHRLLFSVNAWYLDLPFLDSTYVLTITQLYNKTHLMINLNSYKRGRGYM